MRSTILWITAVGLWAQLLAPSDAQETAPIQELRQMLQQQSRQIELLSEQVSRLARAIELHKMPEAPAANNPEPEKPPAAHIAEAPRAEAVPKAEPMPAGPRHVVAKGETLTSIARQYNIPIAELKKANKIENERKLQIGQTLTVPTAKAPENLEKKEDL